MAKKTLREPKRVLLVDDDQDYGQAAADVIGLNGKRSVTIARTIKEATKCLRMGKFDVIVWDYCLTDGTSEELTRATKERFPKTRMIANTGNPDKVQVMKKAGCRVIAEHTRGIEALLKQIDRR